MEIGIAPFPEDGAGFDQVERGVRARGGLDRGAVALQHGNLTRQSLPAVPRLVMFSYSPVIKKTGICLALAIVRMTLRSLLHAG